LTCFQSKGYIFLGPWKLWVQNDWEGFEFLATLILQTHWVNLAFKWIYLSFLALQFILALGNRPKGERLPYAITLWFVNLGFMFFTHTYLYDRVYAFLSVYLFVCSIWLTVKSFQVGHVFYYLHICHLWWFRKSILRGTLWESSSHLSVLW
jgi:hypothetical protein